MEGDLFLPCVTAWWPSHSAPKILFSGKHGSYMKDVTDLTEAEKYAQLATSNGVDAADIIMEKESINTVENVVNSSKLLHEMGYVPKTIIAVSLPYHMKRASLTLRAGMDLDFTGGRHTGTRYVDMVHVRDNGTFAR